MIPTRSLHGDTKRLPFLTGKLVFGKREYPSATINDFSEELYTAVLQNKIQTFARMILKKVLEDCYCMIGQYDTDDGKEYRRDPAHHACMILGLDHRIEQRFITSKTSGTNGKAGQVIKTIMDMWRTGSASHRQLTGKTNYDGLLTSITVSKPTEILMV